MKDWIYQTLSFQFCPSPDTDCCSDETLQATDRCGLKNPFQNSCQGILFVETCPYTLTLTPVIKSPLEAKDLGKKRTMPWNFGRRIVHLHVWQFFIQSISKRSILKIQCLNRGIV
jgi:hypothetical protein